MEKGTNCGYSYEHTHSSSCYENKLECGFKETDGGRVLICEVPVHVHEESCYDDNGNLICGEADYTIHKHEDSCYENGVLICNFKEAEEHTHTDACYEVSKKLTCGLEEAQGHIHSDACYEHRLTCTSQGDGHIHDDTCYEDILVCGLKETEGHTHSDDCYEEERTLICEKPEVVEHIHDQTCYQIKDHEHTDKCRNEKGFLVCGGLSCGKLETYKHQHDASCFTIQEAHTHSEDCYRKELVCGREEHTHTDDCYETHVFSTFTQEVPGADLPLCGKREHTHNPDTCFKDGEIICGEEVHIHTADCYVNPEEVMPTANDIPAPVSAGDDDLLSSDLTDFLKNVTIKDDKGKTVDPGGSVYVGEKYTIELWFKEESGGIQFTENGKGQMTYQLPDNFKCEPQGPIELKVGDEVIGHYSIDKNGLLTVDFEDDYKDGKKYYDLFQDTGITITLDTEAQLSESGNGQNFGGDLGDIEWNITEDAALDANKRFEGFNVVKDEISYSVEVTPSHGDLHTPTIVDSMDHKTDFVDIDSVTITDAAGHKTTLSKDDYTLKRTEDGFELTLKREVKNGETLRVEYRGKVNSEGINSDGDIDYTDDNNVRIYDKSNPDVHIEDSTSETITDYAIRKSGWTTKNSAGDRLIGWEVRVSVAALGDVINDIISDGQEYYTGSRIPTLSFYDENGKNTGSIQLKFGTSDAQIAADGKSATFKMPEIPEGTAYVVLSYYTIYSDSSDGLFEYTNTASTGKVSDDCTIRTAPDGVVKTVNETYTGDDGREYIEYRVDASVPAGPYESRFYFVDKLRFYDTNGQTYYARNELYDISIFVTKEDGTIDVYREYDGVGSTDGTFCRYAYNNDQEQIKDNNGYYTLLFNCDGTSRGDSNWPYDEPVTITFYYSIPTDIAVQGDDGSIRVLKDLLSEGNPLNNKATLNLDAAGAEMEDDVDYVDPETSKRLSKESKIIRQYECGMEEGIDHHHTAECGEGSYIEYTVTFKNWDGLKAKNSAHQLIPDPRSMSITDTFDSSILEFVGITGIDWDTPTRDDTEAKFTYTGGNPVVEDGKIVLNPRDFVMTGGSKKSGNGNYWSGYKYHELDVKDKNATLYECMWGRSDTYLDGEGKSHKDGYTLILKYKMKIKDSVLDNAMSSYITADNTASLDFGPDCGVKDYTYNDSNHVEYNTGMMGKMVGEIRGNRVPFTIYLNGERKTLTDGTQSIDLKDFMSMNLSLDWNTVKVETASTDASGNLVWNELPYPGGYTKSYDTNEEVTDKSGETYMANVLTIRGLPDSTYIRVSYETIVVGIGNVRCTNRAELNGKAVIQDSTDTTFDVNNSGGSVSGSNKSFTVIKHDPDKDAYLVGAKFDVYILGARPVGVASAPETFEFGDETYTGYKIGSLETGADGSADFENQYLIDGRTYVLKETCAPENYQLPDKPVIFVYRSDASGSEVVGEDAEEVYTVLEVDNHSYGVELPQTGGTGISFGTWAGALLAAVGAFSLVYRNRRKPLQGK